MKTLKDQLNQIADWKHCPDIELHSHQVAIVCNVIAHKVNCGLNKYRIPFSIRFKKRFNNHYGYGIIFDIDSCKHFIDMFSDIQVWASFDDDTDIAYITIQRSNNLIENGDVIKATRILLEDYGLKLFGKQTKGPINISTVLKLRHGVEHIPESYRMIMVKNPFFVNVMSSDVLIMWLEVYTIIMYTKNVEQDKHKGSEE